MAYEHRIITAEEGYFYHNADMTVYGISISLGKGVKKSDFTMSPMSEWPEEPEEEGGE